MLLVNLLLLLVVSAYLPLIVLIALLLLLLVICLFIIALLVWLTMLVLLRGYCLLRLRHHHLLLRELKILLWHHGSWHSIHLYVPPLVHHVVGVLWSSLHLLGLRRSGWLA